MRKFQLGGILTAVFLWSNITISAEIEGRYPWCIKRMDNLKEQMVMAEKLDNPKRMQRLEQQMQRVYEKCELGEAPFIIDSPREHGEQVRGRGEDRREKEHRPQLTEADHKRAMEEHLLKERLKLEHKILKQKETIIHVSSDVRKAEYVGDHLQVKLMKEDLERERQLLELYQNELEKIEAREK